MLRGGVHGMLVPQDIYAFARRHFSTENDIPKVRVWKYREEGSYSALLSTRQA